MHTYIHPHKSTQCCIHSLFSLIHHHICTHTHMQTNYSYVHRCMYVCINASIHAYMNVFIDLCSCLYIYTFMHRFTDTRIHICTYIHIYTHTYRPVLAQVPKRQPELLRGMYVCMYVCMYSYVHTYIHTYIHA